MVDNLEIVFTRFLAVWGLAEVWINGSFVELVDHPGDIDAYFTLQDPRDWPHFRQRLNQLEGDPIWDWSLNRRKVYPGAKIPKPPFWGRYHIEPFPDFGRPCGIFGPGGQALTFSQAFRLQRGTFEAKGILRIKDE